MDKEKIKKLAENLLRNIDYIPEAQDVYNIITDIIGIINSNCTIQELIKILYIVKNTMDDKCVEMEVCPSCGEKLKVTCDYDYETNSSYNVEFKCSDCNFLRRK